MGFSCTYNLVKILKLTYYFEQFETRSGSSTNINGPLNLIKWKCKAQNNCVFWNLFKRKLVNRCSISISINLDLYISIFGFIHPSPGITVYPRPTLICVIANPRLTNRTLTSTLCIQQICFSPTRRQLKSCNTQIT